MNVPPYSKETAAGQRRSAAKKLGAARTQDSRQQDYLFLIFKLKLTDEIMAYIVSSEKTDTRIVWEKN